MRLYLLPLTRSRTLIYCKRLNLHAAPDHGYTARVAAKATGYWTKWEKYDSGWQKRITEYGNKLFARIPYQEWGLKSIPPLSARRKGEELEGREDVDVVYPPRALPGSVLDHLHALATERQGLHKKRMWWSLIAMPFTIPFALLPVIPNLPFFYVAWRAWSHWRALLGSQHVHFLLEKGFVRAAPSNLLQRLYDVGPLAPEQIEHLRNTIRTKAGDGETDIDAMEEAVMQELRVDAGPAGVPIESTLVPEELLLPKGHGKLIALCLDTPELEIEVERARDQVSKALSVQKELEQKKQELDSTQKEPGKEERSDEVR